MRRDVIVLSIRNPEGERFAIVQPDDFFRSGRALWSSLGNWLPAMEQWLRAQELMTEDSARARLEGMGLEESAVKAQIARARRISQWNARVVWEQVTVVGHRNEEGQQVVAKTTRVGSEPDQLVFVMQCTVCGHQYGSNGCDIPRRCCPNCQDGPAGEPYP